MAKGDYITVQLRDGGGEKSIEARQNGRTVSYEWANDGKVQWLVVQELTRGGTTVYEGRFAASDVVAVYQQKKDME